MVSPGREKFRIKAVKLARSFQVSTIVYVPGYGLRGCKFDSYWCHIRCSHEKLTKLEIPVDIANKWLLCLVIPVYLGIWSLLQCVAANFIAIKIKLFNNTHVIES